MKKFLSAVGTGLIDGCVAVASESWNAPRKERIAEIDMQIAVLTAEKDQLQSELITD